MADDRGLRSHAPQSEPRTFSGAGLAISRFEPGMYEVVEVELPPGFQRRAAHKWIQRISSKRLKTIWPSASTRSSQEWPDGTLRDRGKSTAYSGTSLVRPILMTGSVDR